MKVTATYAMPDGTILDRTVKGHRVTVQMFEGDHRVVIRTYNRRGKNTRTIMLANAPVVDKWH